jgi:hypothetical protein
MKTAFAAFSCWLVLTMGQVFACVGCREPGSDTIVNEPGTALAGFGFSWGVLFMLVVSMSFFGGMFLYMWRTIMRIERERAQA